MSEEELLWCSDAAAEAYAKVGISAEDCSMFWKMASPLKNATLMAIKMAEITSNIRVVRTNA